MNAWYLSRCAALTASMVGMASCGLALAGSEQSGVRATGQQPVTGAEADPAALVSAMSMALKTLNYEGTFVHVQGNHITSMSILHASGDEGEMERLWALDGEAREVIRNQSMVTCIWPDSQSVVVSKSKPRDLLPNVDASLATNQRYRFTLGRPDRVAGLPTHVVTITPADKFRYGYRFWIDRDTHMLLRSMLLDQHRAVEQVMFTRIDYPRHIDPARFDIMTDKEQVSWLEPKKAKATSGLPDILDDTEQADRVSFRQLPEGYHEVSETYSPKALNDGPVSHVMLTDGMASVSVYVEYSMAASQNTASAGLSSMGAMNAFGISTDVAFITAVGEVPAETVRAIASAVEIN